MGIDSQSPRLSWEVNDPRRGARQTAYRILVVETSSSLEIPDKRIWDSGKVISAQSVHVAYGGPALASGGRYYWTVRTWDMDGRPGPFTTPAYWEMGLLERDDWVAEWIAAPEKATPGSQILPGDWIWCKADKAAQAHVFFRTSFSLPEDKTVRTAFAQLTADDSFVLYVNGTRCGEASQWRELHVVDLRAHLRPGENIFAIEAKDDGGAYGLTAGVEITYCDDTSTTLVSGSDWLCTTQSATGWNLPEFQAKNWTPATVIGEYGQGARGRIEYRDPAHSHCFRKEFTLADEASSGRAYVSGLGLYELRINGERVGADTLTPGWTHFPTRVQYQIYDVTPFLKKGANAIAAQMGNGWWGSIMGGNWRDGMPRFICQLTVTYPDGVQENIVTDETWLVGPSPILENSLFDGETYDARLEQTGWDAADFDDTDWMKAVAALDVSATLVTQATPPMRTTEQLEAVSITEPSPGVYVFDFGQNHAGRVRLSVSGTHGTRIQIRHSEILNPDGMLYTDNYRMARATDVYILKG
ncbi:MAG: family 78 glycoside hydrolase catalytic domain, partial [Candidatus Hydrogenedentes bacterium]|nr:family 78 glycoside hydrolase catalytic domain [Candidatus Hydrogenedentota bacterium]